MWDNFCKSTKKIRVWKFGKDLDFIKSKLRIKLANTLTKFLDVTSKHYVSSKFELILIKVLRKTLTWSGLVEILKSI